MFVFKHFLAFAVILSGFLTNKFLQTAQQSSLKGGMLCPKLGGVASPFFLAGLLNRGDAKTGNRRVNQNRDDQGTNGD